MNTKMSESYRETNNDADFIYYVKSCLLQES